MLHAEAEIVFAHLNAPRLGTFFRPGDVPDDDAAAGGVSTWATPPTAARLVPPARLLQGRAAASVTSRRPTQRKECNHETTRCGHRHRLRHAPWAPTSRRSGSGCWPASRASATPRSSTPATSPPRSRPRSATGTSPTSARIPDDWKYQGRHTHFAVGAAKKAMADSGVLDTPLDPTRFGVYTGSGEGQQDFDRFTQMMVAGLAGGNDARPGQVHPQRAWNCCTPSPSWSRSRTCRPGTWPACSTPRGRTSTA